MLLPRVAIAALGELLVEFAPYAMIADCCRCVTRCVGAVTRCVARFTLRCCHAYTDYIRTALCCPRVYTLYHPVPLPLRATAFAVAFALRAYARLDCRCYVGAGAIRRCRCWWAGVVPGAALPRFYLDRVYALFCYTPAVAEFTVLFRCDCSELRAWVLLLGECCCTVVVTITLLPCYLFH